MKLFLRILIPAFLFSPASAQNPDLVPWEREDLHVASTDSPAPSAIIATGLIIFYQNHISPQSVSRCPYLISCSNFALQAIRDDGFLVGTALFIDRNLYRENHDARNHYGLVLNQGVFKLEDSYFLKAPTP